MTARDGEVLALDVEGHDGAAMLQDGRDDGADALAAAGAGDGEVMAAAPAMGVVVGVAQKPALVARQRQAGPVAGKAVDIGLVHPSGAPRAGARGAILADPWIDQGRDGKG